MLGDEDGMAAHRRLLAVVRRMRRRQPFGDEGPAMIEDGVETLLREIGSLLGSQAETAPEGGLRKGQKKVVRGYHVGALIWNSLRLL